MFATSTPDALLRAARGDRTGCLTIVDRKSGLTARLYLVDGSAYSVDLDRYRPAVLERLVCAGALGRTEADALRGDAEATRTAVERGWVMIDAVAEVHQELLVASFGALCERPRIRVRFEEGITTADRCAIPTAMGDLVAAARFRRERAESTWRAVTSTGTPHDMRLEVIEPVALGDSADLAAFLRTASGAHSIDECARRLGLTRAEAIHLSALATLSGRAVAVPCTPMPAVDLAVPEGFGSTALDRDAAPVGPEQSERIREEIQRLEAQLADLRVQLAASARP